MATPTIQSHVPTPPALLQISQDYELKVHGNTPPLYVLCMVGTRQVAGARRGARVKSIAIGFNRPWVHVFKVNLMVMLILSPFCF